MVTETKTRTRTKAPAATPQEGHTKAATPRKARKTPNAPAAIPEAVQPVTPEAEAPKPWPTLDTTIHARPAFAYTLKPEAFDAFRPTWIAPEAMRDTRETIEAKIEALRYMSARRRRFSLPALHLPAFRMPRVSVGHTAVIGVTAIVIAAMIWPSATPTHGSRLQLQTAFACAEDESLRFGSAAEFRAHGYDPTLARDYVACLPEAD